MREELREGKKRLAREEGWRRQQKLLDYQTASLIRESEEWCMDTSEMKAHRAQHQQLHRWREQSLLFQALAALPLLALMLLALCSLPFPALRQMALFGRGMSVFAVLAFVWFAWCQVETFRRLAWIKRQVHLSELDVS